MESEPELSEERQPPHGRQVANLSGERTITTRQVPSLEDPSDLVLSVELDTYDIDSGHKMSHRIWRADAGRQPSDEIIDALVELERLKSEKTRIPSDA